MSDEHLTATIQNQETQTLGQLLAGVTSDNLHDEVDFGLPIGKEIIPEYAAAAG